MLRSNSETFVHMPRNPYEAPAAHVEDRSAKDFSWWAVWVAATAGTGTALIIGRWIGPPFQHWFSARGLSLEEVYRTMVQSIGFGVAVVLLSAFGYALAGYTAASLAPGRPVVHAVVAALICMATGAVYYL